MIIPAMEVLPLSDVRGELIESTCAIATPVQSALQESMVDPNEMSYHVEEQPAARQQPCRYSPQPSESLS